MDLVVLSSFAEMGYLGPVGWLHMFEIDMEHFAHQNLRVVVAICWRLGCVVLDRTSMCSVCIATLT